MGFSLLKVSCIQKRQRLSRCICPIALRNRSPQEGLFWRYYTADSFFSYFAHRSRQLMDGTLILLHGSLDDHECAVNRLAALLMDSRREQQN